MAELELLEITDGTETISLIKDDGSYGLHFVNWSPATVSSKGGGVWSNSAMGDGRRLLLRRWDNAVETFELKVNGGDQDGTIAEVQGLHRLLEKGIEYWTKDFSETPVWIRARGRCETNVRYAYVHDYETKGEGNPFDSSFNGPEPFFPSFFLAIERSHWLGSEPGSPDALPLDGSFQDPVYTEKLLNPSFETAGGGGADVFSNWTESAGTGTIVRATGAGNFLPGSGVASCQLTSGAGANTYVEQSMAVTAGLRYSLTFYYRAVTLVGYTPRLEVYDVTNATDILSLNALTWMADSVNDWVRWQRIFTAPAGCSSIRIRFYCNLTLASVVLFDAMSFSEISFATYGKSYTTSEEVFIANKHNQAQITDIYRWDNSAATFSANLARTTLPFDLFPNPVEANDATYFGVNDAGFWSGPFTNLIFDLNNLGVDSNFIAAPQYWNGTIWTNITNIDYQVNVNADPIFTKDGVGFIAWDPPSDWARTLVNGVFGWWIRVPMPGTIAPSPRVQQQNRWVYIANKPYVTVNSVQLLGDLPGLLRVTHRVSPGFPSYGGGTTAPVARYHLSSRKTSRGSSFVPYVHLGYFGRPDYTSVTVSNAVSGIFDVLTTSPASPVGWYTQFTGSIAGDTGTVTLTISNPLCNEYFGTFRLLLRCHLVSGSASVRLTELRAGSMYVAPKKTVIPTASSEQLVDLGKFTFPFIRLDGNSISSISMIFTLISEGGASSLRLYDVLFLPVDEVSVETITEISATDPKSSMYNQLSSLDPRFMVLGTAINATLQQHSTPGGNPLDGMVPGAVQVLSTSEIVLDSYTQQRIHLITLDDNALVSSYPEPQDLFRLSALFVPRYQGMRGDG